MKRTVTTLLALAVAAPAFAYGVEPAHPNLDPIPSQSDIRAQADANSAVNIIERIAPQTTAGGGVLPGETLKFETIYESADDAAAPVSGRKLR